MKRREFLGYSGTILGASLTFGAFGMQILQADHKDFLDKYTRSEYAICNAQ